MDQNSKRSEDMPNRSSNMEQAEGSRENVRNSGGDLGSSSDRAMFSERMNQSDGRSSSDESSSSERGVGSSGERNRSSESSSSSKSGGITNRSLDEEQCEQQQLPERGRSQSER